MAEKPKTVFVCQECGYESPKWMGQCICGAWNSFVEEKIASEAADDRRGRSTDQSRRKSAKLAEISSETHERIDTGIGELNRVLGGGLVKGSLTLITGEPGIGKSTIILQAAANIAANKGTVLYVSGEESEEQVKLRAERMCRRCLPESLYHTCRDQYGRTWIWRYAGSSSLAFVIIDSIQTMHSADLDSAPGSVSQVRAWGRELMMRIGKVYNIPVIHRGACDQEQASWRALRTVEHMVDCVLRLSQG